MAKIDKTVAAMRTAPQNIPYIDLQPGEGLPGPTGAQGHRQAERGGTDVTDVKHYAYRVLWSAEDGEHVATVAEFPSLSWLHADQAKALRDLVDLVADVVADLEANGEPIPEPLAERRFSGKFNVRVPESLHRELALAAAEAGVSMNRLVSDRLAHG